MPISDLEKRRLENIARNEQLLKELELKGIGDEIFTDVRKSAGRTTSPKKKRPLPVKKEPEITPRRKSRRLEGKKAESEIEKENAQLQLVLDKKTAEEDRARKEGQMNLSEIVNRGDWSQTLDVLSDLGSKVSQGDYFDNIIYDNPDIKSARANLSHLSLMDKVDPNNIKVTTERIFSVEFHPSTDKRLVLAGDKVGEVGIWDVDQVTIEDDQEVAQILSLKAHTRAVATIAIDPRSSQKAYTCSYDGSIRCLDLKMGISTEVFVYGDDPRNPIGISDFGLAEPNIVYFSTLDGEFGVHDLRNKFSAAKILRLHEKKIGGFSFNPNAVHQIATASLDRTMKIWDLRATPRIGHTKETTAHGYGEYLSRLSISATEWNSSGQILINGYDDTINVFDVANSDSWTTKTTFEDPFEPKVRIKHNCQSGRWVSILKARWHKNPADGVNKFVIANMRRFIDIYSGDGKQLAHLGHEAMSAVPAVVQFHPSQNWVVGGSASGKLYLWE
jgi:WD40 repeat protein